MSSVLSDRFHEKRASIKRAAEQSELEFGVMNLQATLKRYKFMWIFMFVGLVLAGTVGALAGGVGLCIDEWILRRKKKTEPITAHAGEKTRNGKELLFGEFDPNDLIDEDISVIPLYHNKFAVMFIFLSSAYAFTIYYGYIKGWSVFIWWVSESQMFFATIGSALPILDKYSAGLKADMPCALSPAEY